MKRKIYNIKFYEIIILVAALLLQSFSFFISFCDLIVSNGFLQICLDLTYTLRDCCLLLSIAIIVLRNRLKIDCILLIVFFIIAYLLTVLFNQKNIPYFSELQISVILSIQVYIIIRSELISFSVFKSIIHVVSRILCILAVLIFLLEKDTIFFQRHYMDFANAISLVCGVLLYFGIMETKKIDFIFGGLLYLAILLSGSRGSLLTLSILICILMWLKMKWKAVLIVGILFITMLFVIELGLAENFLVFLTEKFGIESRTISRILEADFFKGNDRFELYRYLCDKIIEDMFLGGGLCADRYYLISGGLEKNGTYAHNIFLEMIVDFGIIGFFISLGLLKLLFDFFKTVKDNNIKGFISVYIIVAFVQLMLSRSWLTEPNFFILFALVINFKKGKCYDGATISKCINTNIQKQFYIDKSY